MQLVLRNNDTTFQKYVISLADYERSKIGKNEIYLHGKMYDVKAVHIRGGQVELYAVQDADEDELNEKIKKASCGKLPSRDFPKPLIELLTLDYLLPVFPAIIGSPEIRQMLYKPLNDALPSCCLDNYFPPPQLS